MSMRHRVGLEAFDDLAPGGVMCIGNFDGLHVGHRTIMETARSIAGAGRLIVTTFEPHPLTVLRPPLAPPRLTPPSVKRSILEQMGVDELIELPPTDGVLNLSAEQFFERLRDGARVRHLCEGRSFYFGRARSGDVDKLSTWCGASGIGLTVVDDVEVALADGTIVAAGSSMVRWLLSYGRVADAARCLGRPYQLVGRVVGGERRGRTIGVPTANLDDMDQLIPAPGVYAGRCVVDGTSRPLALSIGSKPTFDGRAVSVEGHLLDFSGDLYDRRLTFELTHWVRDQMKFPGLDALRRQMFIDIDNVRRLTR
jgi:riboflavin kinase / FMN adenylyltransferase